MAFAGLFGHHMHCHQPLDGAAPFCSHGNSDNSPLPVWAGLCRHQLQQIWSPVTSPLLRLAAVAVTSEGPAAASAVQEPAAAGFVSVEHPAPVAATLNQLAAVELVEAVAVVD